VGVRTPELLHEALALVQQHGGNTSAAARAAGLPRGTLLNRIRAAEASGVTLPTPKPFEVEELPDELPTAEELLAYRTKAFARKARAKEARALIQVTVKIDGPYGIAHFGDPHVDDDGTDLGLLQRHVDVVNRTEGLFAANVGDYTNSWVGRLARLYGQQSTSAKEAWVLAEWLVNAVDWLYLVGGNHDAWNGDGDPLNWISAQAGALYEMHGARLALTSPNGKTIRINARHDFKGHSMYNTAHGAMKAAKMGWRDHILTCGHTHVSGFGFEKDPSSGLISNCIRIASYKTWDRYAEEKGLPNQTIFMCPVTIIQPQYADNDPRLVTFFADPEQGADFLTFLRSRKSA
jgi:transposase-like protein